MKVLNEYIVGLRQPPLPVRVVLYFSGIWALAAPLILMMGGSAGVLKLNIQTQTVFAVSSLFYIATVMVMLKRLQFTTQELASERAARQRVRDFMTVRVADQGRARFAQDYKVIEVFQDGNAIGAMRILWNQLKATARSLEASEARANELERLLQQLVGYTPVREKEEGGQYMSDEERNEHFEQKLAHYKNSVASWVTLQSQALHLIEAPDSRSRRELRLYMDIGVFERMLNLLAQHRGWVSTTASTFGMRAPSLWDDEETRARFGERLSGAKETVSLQRVQELEQRVGYMQRERAFTSLALACDLYDLRPTKKAEEMSENELRRELLELIGKLKRMRIQSAQMHIEYLRDHGVTIAHMLNTFGKDRTSVAREALMEAMRAALNEGLLIDTENNNDHPQARELIQLCMVDPKEETPGEDSETA